LSAIAQGNEETDREVHSRVPGMGMN